MLAEIVFEKINFGKQFRIHNIFHMGHAATKPDKVNIGITKDLRFLAKTIFISSRNCQNTLGKICFFIGPNYFLLLAQIGRNYFKVV